MRSEEQPHLSVQCRLPDKDFPRLLFYIEHVFFAFWLLADDFIGKLRINCSFLVIVLPLDLHHKGSCGGSQQDRKMLV